MNLLTTLVRSLGNDRALANAGAAMEATKREDWIIQGLSLRLDRLPGPASQPAAAMRATG